MQSHLSCPRYGCRRVIISCSSCGRLQTGCSAANHLMTAGLQSKWLAVSPELSALRLQARDDLVQQHAQAVDVRGQVAVPSKQQLGRRIWERARHVVRWILHMYRNQVRISPATAHQKQRPADVLQYWDARVTGRRSESGAALTDC